ncbi:hypothetical protein H5J22_01460 [Cetobacterium sp. 8H]|uniref:hypothetical protein n=1 Tax=Cetobacterium sp. 8H TaxID=2759681 RepID=UPI00163C9CD1|nr:hypothetical protein [Cetobacterium sp. 8H]MBC2850130.1 hypothetical protein [Cetobacterium sp. 8H]
MKKDFYLIGEISNFKTTNISGITGDGHLMCEKVGADFIQMEYIQTFPISNPETGELSHVGGNRLGGNAITEIIVFGKREGENIIK